TPDPRHARHDARGGHGARAFVPPVVRRPAGLRDRRRVEPRALRRAGGEHGAGGPARDGPRVSWLRVVRGTMAVAALMAWLVVGGLYQRVIVYPLAYLFPRRRAAIVSAYFRGMSH